MNDVFGGCGRWSSLLGLALALGCSSQQAPDSASGGTSGGAAGGAGGDAVVDGGAAPEGANCSITIDRIPLQDGGDACAIRVGLPQSSSQDNVRLQDQSMATIPYSQNGSSGWLFGDPDAPIILVGTYCDDAMSGLLTTVYVRVACPGHPIP